MALNQGQVSKFLKTVLRFQNWENLLQDNKFQFLRKFLLLQSQNVYFQGITMASIPLEKRKGPTLSEVITSGMNGTGGLCIHHNYFSRLVLETLGFDVFTVQGSFPIIGIPGHHCSTVVQLSKNELYLIDSGFALPGVEPVPLHDLPFRYQEGGVIHEFRQENDGTISRYQIGGNLFASFDDDKDTKREVMRVTISLKPVKFSAFTEQMHTVFTNVKRCFGLRTPFLFRYMDTEEDEELKWVYIWGTALLEGNQKYRKLTNYENLDEMVPVIKKYFPKIDSLQLKNAMPVFKTFNEKPHF